MIRPSKTQTAGAALLACALAAPDTGAGAANRGPAQSELVLRLKLDSAQKTRLDDLDRGELSITWGRSEATISVASLETEDAERRSVDRISAAPAGNGCFLVAAFDHSERNRLGGRTELRGRGSVALQHDSARFLRADLDEGSKLRITLFDDDDGGRAIDYLDGRVYEHVVMRFRGTESVDAVWRDGQDRRGEPISLSPAAGWTDVVLPTRIDKIHDHHLATLEFIASENTRIEIDDLYLCGRSARPLRPSARSRAASNAMWVWHTSDLMEGGPEAVDELVTLSRQVAVDVVYLQVPSGLDRQSVQKSLERVVSGLSAAGVRAFALDGAPAFVLPEGRRDLERTLERVAAYNEGSDSEGRFVGVHLDVEPYLLEEWRKDRDAVANAFIEMLDSVHRYTAQHDLLFDIAVPFWFDGIRVRDDESEPVRWRSLLSASLDHVDSIAVMDYRTSASGSNGILALGAQELAVAAQTGGAVRLGLETTWLPDQTLLRFSDEPHDGLPEPLGREWWIVQAGSTMWAVQETGLDNFADGLSRRDRDRARHWRARAVEIPATRQTFYDLGAAPLQRAMTETAAALEGHPAFLGFALHYDRPLRRLLEAGN